MNRRYLSYAVMFVTAATLGTAGCSSSGSGTGGAGGTGAGGAGGASNDGGSGLPLFTGTITPENVCTTSNVEDEEADSAPRKVVWTFSVGHPCQAIKAGQTVTFVDPSGNAPADFSTHPPSFTNVGGGAKPTLDMATGKLTFPGAGTYTFQCGNHPQMHGAIYVF